MYTKWNRALASHFFRPDMAGRPVHLYVTEELLGKLGAEFGEGPRAFVEAVKRGPPSATRTGLCQKALQTYQNWRARGWVYPPYIAYLGLFVLAAGLEGDFSPHAYYPRLRRLIGEPPGGMLPSFDRMRELWDDLERWSNQDKRGELGVFTIHIAGGWVHVGVPIAQVILTEHERRSLPLVFARAQLDPTAPPSDAELTRLLRRHGTEYLRPLTRNLLNRSHEEAELYGILIETVREELASWDGTVQLPAADQTTPPPAYGFLRLCVTLDRVSGKVQTYFRCRVNRPFPEEGLLLREEQYGELLSCTEELPGWSSPLAYHGTNRCVDASQYDWNQGFELEEESRKWHFRLPGGPIRIFVLGPHEGLPGLVEVQRLAQSVPFYIAIREEQAEPVVAWGRLSCREFTELEIREGLPAGWRFFGSSGALSDAGIREAYPILSFSDTARLSLRGGIRVGQGNSFFDFACPEITVEGGDGSEKVFCEGRELELRPETRTYLLPAELPSGTRLFVELRRGSDVVRRLSLYLESDLCWQWEGPLQIFGQFGERLGAPEIDMPGLAGAHLKGISVPEYAFTLNPHFFGEDRIFFIGPAPGQIIEWPNEALPRDWSPVWAISVRRKRGAAIFCGTSVDDSKPVAATSEDRRRLKLWKEKLWVWRKRIAPPCEPRLRQLWKEFQKVACRV